MEEVFSLVGLEYEVIGEYIQSNEKIMMKHVACGHEYPVKPVMFLRGNRCPQCFQNIKKTTDQFEQEVLELVGTEYEVIGDYLGASEYIQMKHVVCGHGYPIVAVSFLRGKRCPHCKDSKGERAIYEFLERKGIKFTRQYKIDECRHINPLFLISPFFTNKKL
ncbi:hypothetical protein R4Z09_14240 [Niallia oryzisoli]|uniref:Uncharacterized protein n=1 Tax=Niallia oryzisoli TaxID=1737571 RepID=A0ABZ2CJS9_9BACI